VDDALASLALLAAAVGGGILVGWLMQNRRSAGKASLLKPSMPLRLVGPGGVSRSTLRAVRRRTLEITPPLTLDRDWRPESGQRLMVQCPTDDGLISFTTHISDVKPDGLIVVQKPEYLRRIERRSEPRSSLCFGRPIQINGRPAVLVNLSAGGAKVMAQAPIHPGDELDVELPDGMGKAEGWALDAVPLESDEWSVRIRFDHPLSGLHTRQ
jgi:c-di-GMP-binding flagellar brake protein YcgR